MSDSHDELKQNYDIEFVVKYKQIEDDLREKFDDLSEEDKEEAEGMMDELYRHEIIQVFKLEDINDDKIGDTIMYLWKEMRNYDLVRTFIESYKERFFGDSFTDDVVFTSLYGFPTFHAIHPCVCEYLKTGAISENIWETLLESASETNQYL